SPPLARGPLGSMKRASDRALRGLDRVAVVEPRPSASVILVRDAPHGLETFMVLQVDAADQSLQERLESTRLALQARDFSLARVLADWGWQPAFDLLVPFSHWVTPTVLAARFDTRFFVAVMPSGQSALHDTIETSEGAWLAPARVLESDYHTLYATAQHLRRLCPYHSVAELLPFAAAKDIRRIQPEVVESGS